MKKKVMDIVIKRKVTPISISKLKVWENGNVRKHEIFEGIEELAKNIREVGLINPLLVWEKNENEYEVISGQRRLEACRLLNQSPIDCIIIDKPTVEKGMLLSLSENLYRLPMTPDDISDACDILYQKFANIETVAKRLGVSSGTVRKYLGYRKVPEEIKQLVRDKLLTPSQALLIYTQFPDPKKQFAIARELAKISDRTDKARFTQAIKESNPLDDLEKIKNRARELKEGRKYTIFLRNKVSNAVEKSANEMEVEPEFVITEVIEDWTDKRQKDQLLVS